MEKMIDILYGILGASWDLYLDVAIFMLFGFLIAGLLYVFFNADQIKRHLGTGKIRPVFLSALFGIPLPLCSCPQPAGFHGSARTESRIAAVYPCRPRTQPRVQLCPRSPIYCVQQCL